MDGTRRRRQVVKHALAAFVPFAALFGVIVALIYAGELRTDNVLTRERERQRADAIRKSIRSAYGEAIADLKFVLKLAELRQILRGSGEARDALAQELLAFSRDRRVYDQIRVLDGAGREAVRINFNAGQPSIVPRDQLQDKGKRYYFTDTLALARGEIYVSPFDLNIERGEIERPRKPMIRFGTPICDGEGTKRGAVILNLLGDSLLRLLDPPPTDVHGRAAMLINPQGSFLRGPKTEDEWGFMYGHDRRFETRFPATWPALAGADAGQVRNAEGLFTFATVRPLAKGHRSSTGSATAFGEGGRPVEPRDYFWTIVCHVPRRLLNAGPRALLRALLRLYAVLLALLALGSWGFGRAAAERARTAAERERLIGELRHSLANVKTLHGLLPICAACKKVRNDQGYWEEIEAYISDHSDADFTHGICPECTRRLYPELYGEPPVFADGNTDDGDDEG